MSHNLNSQHPPSNPEKKKLYNNPPFITPLRRLDYSSCGILGFRTCSYGCRILGILSYQNTFLVRHREGSAWWYCQGILTQTPGWFTQTLPNTLNEKLSGMGFRVCIVHCLNEPSLNTFGLHSMSLFGWSFSLRVQGPQ